MKHLKTTSLTLVMALATLFYSCENDAPLDTFEGITLLDASNSIGVACDNTTNPSCAFVADMDYITSAPIIAERVLRLCPIGFNCIYTPDANSLTDSHMYCPDPYTSPNPAETCTGNFNLFSSFSPIVTAAKLNESVCILTDQICILLGEGKMPISVVVEPRQQTSTAGIQYFHVAFINYKEINRKIPSPCL